MTTTIQIDVKTLRLLKQLKGRLKAKTYDDLIRRLISKKTDLPTSFFGINPEIPSFSEEDHLKIHDED